MSIGDLPDLNLVPDNETFKIAAKRFLISGSKFKAKKVHYQKMIETCSLKQADRVLNLASCLLQEDSEQLTPILMERWKNLFHLEFKKGEKLSGIPLIDFLVDLRSFAPSEQKLIINKKLKELSGPTSKDRYRPVSKLRNGFGLKGGRLLNTLSKDEPRSHG
ncbi:MAG: hypothetical protein WDK96_03880 [Candidatus Paceibacterota bacterium]|jgi:hypothetical protein